MSGKTILSVDSPVTQSREAVETLLKVLRRQVDPLPEVVEMANGVRLVLSGKRDGYYTTSTQTCSCPARTFHPDQPCKHMKALQGGDSVNAARAQARAYQAAQRERRARAKASSLPEPGDSLMPRGGFRPIAEEVV